jgi:Mg/Co/Ni transporter MgtE
VVPIRERVFARPDRRISDIMKRDVAAVRVDDDQEEIPRRKVDPTMASGIFLTTVTDVAGFFCLGLATVALECFAI